MSDADSNGVDIAVLALHRKAPQTLYAAVGGRGIAKTTQGGTRWSPINTGLADVGSSSADRWRLALDPSQPNILYAGATTGGVYKSSDGGGSWFSSGLEAARIRDLVIDSNQPADPLCRHAERGVQNHQRRWELGLR